MIWKGIAKRLHVGSWPYASNRLYQSPTSAQGQLVLALVKSWSVDAPSVAGGLDLARDFNQYVALPNEVHCPWQRCLQKAPQGCLAGVAAGKPDY